MRSDLVRRLFRAIQERSWPDLVRLSSAIISEEKKKGHVQLARQLQSMMERPSVPERELSHSPAIGIGELSELPKSRRNNQPLVTMIEREKLRHHMVLRGDIESRLGRIEREFVARDRLARHGLKNRQKVLLYGPPGCGKTLAVERLAFKVGLPVMKVRFDALMSSFFGESATNLRTVFDSARASPCLLLLDECDFVARSRLQVNDVGEAPRIVNTFLQMLEDFEGQGLLVATTNLYSSLDAAVFRRFDESIEMPLPETGQVEELLRMTLSSLNVSSSVQWRRIEEQLLGQSAAAVVLAAQNAAKECVMTGSKLVEQWHFDKALAEFPRRN